MSPTLPGGPGGALLVGLTALSWLFALLRLALRRRSALPGMGLAMGGAVAATAALLLHLGLQEALDLVALARPIMRRAMLQAALEEATAPLPTSAALVAFALAPHAALAWRERPVSGRGLPWALGAAAALALAGALATTLQARELLVELSPVLEQQDMPPDGLFTLIDDELRGPLSRAATLDLIALSLAGLASVASLFVGVLGLARSASDQNKAA